MGSNPKQSLPFRSIPDIITPYRNSFSDKDFKYVLSTLTSREKFLKQDSERQLGRLRRELNAIKEEGIRVLELEKSELLSQLEVLKSSLIESNDHVESLARVSGEKDEEICRLVGKLSEICVENEKIRVLLREIEVKLVDKVKVADELMNLELLSVEIKDEIEGLRRVLGKKNAEISEKDERIEMLMRRVEALEEEKRENEAKTDEMVSEVEMVRRENEGLIAAKKGCDEEVDKLKKERSEVECRVETLWKENQRLMVVNAGVEERLEREKTRGFVTQFPMETKRRKVFSQCSNQINQTNDTGGKSLSPGVQIAKTVDKEVVILL